MTCFMMNGQTVRVLDMSVERDGERVYHEPKKSFIERLMAELKEEPYEGDEKLLVAYSEGVCTQITTKPSQVLRLSLTGQTYVYQPLKKRLTQGAVAVVLYKYQGKYIPLYEQRYFRQKKEYMFLNPQELKKTLSKVFSSIELKLGLLTHERIPCIAWQVSTEDGEYYIPWHNGCIFKGDDTLLFEEKPLEQMRRTYELFRFAPSGITTGAYHIICC